MDRMIGQALDIAPNAEHRACIEERNAVRRVTERHDNRDGADHVIIGGRAEGKSTLAEKWLMDAPEGVDRVLVIRGPQHRAEHVRNKLGLKRNDRRVATVYEYAHGRCDAPGTQYGVDDAGHILADLLGIRERLSLLTITTSADWQTDDHDETPGTRPGTGRNHHRFLNGPGGADHPGPSP